MKKWVFRGLIIFSSTLLLSGVGLGVGLSYVNKENVNKVLVNDDLKKQKVSFDGKEFDNVEDAYSYAKSNVKKVKLDISNKDLYSLNVNNEMKLFKSVTELSNFVNNEIKVIENCNTNIINHNLDPADNSIYLNDLYKYNVDISTNTKFDDNYINIYKKNGGGYVPEENSPEEAIRKAKESYLEIHKAFYFNGIYFKSKQDLEIYLRNVYVKKFINENDNTVNNSKYKKIYYTDEQGKTYVSQPIDFSKNIEDILVDVSKFIETNNYQYLRIYDSNTSSAKFLKFDKFQNSIVGNLGETISITNLPILKKLNTKNKDLYIVDANVSEKYELYGPYFLNTDAPIEKITDPAAWTISHDDPYEMVRSQAITLLSSFLDLFLTKNDSTTNSRAHKTLFYISELSDEIFEAEQNLLNALSKIKTGNNSNLLLDLYDMYNSLQHTKSYCTIYAIPTIYNFLKDQLIINQADPLTVLLFRTYFDVLCSNIQSIFEGIFGDLLNEFNNDNGKRFNFAHFFGINVYGFDGSNIGSILNGNNLIKTYKPLLAGCYVFMKAIGNSQNCLIPNYDSSTDDHLFKILEEGKNNDQNTSEKIRHIFINQKICNKLNTIYKTFSNWSKIIDENLFSKLDSLSINNSSTINDKLDFLVSTIREYKNNNQELPSQVNKEFIDMQKELNVNQEFMLTNTRSSKGFSIFLKQSFINKQSSNLDFKINSINQANLFINNQKQSNWCTDGGIFGNSEISFQLQSISKNFNTSLATSSYKEIVMQTSIVNQINTTKNDKVFKKINLAGKITSQAGNIASTIIGLVNDVNNEKFDEVQDQIIAAGVMNICASIADIASNFTPPPFDLIVKAASLVFSFISAAIGEAKTQIYEFKVGEGDNLVKYYWDGGLVMSRFWGLWQDTIRDINDLNMESPIQIIRSQNYDSLYFNGREYEMEDDGIAKKDAIEFILNTMNEKNEIYDMIKSKFSWVYSLESNINKITDKNSFAKIYSKDPNEMTLSKYAIENNVINVESELFLDGYAFNNKIDLEENLKRYVIDAIKPFYITKIPNLDRNNIPLGKQIPYHIPYPYFEPSNNTQEQLVCSDKLKLNADITIDNNKKSSIPTNQDQQYIIYNSNSKDNIKPGISTYNEATINDIFNNIKTRFLNTFEVETKRILKTNLLDSNYELFDNFETNLQTLNIYYVEVEKGVKKYFTNKLDAERYIFNTTTYNNSIKLDLISKDIYQYRNKNDIKLFESLEQFNKWFASNTISLTGGK